MAAIVTRPSRWAIAANALALICGVMVVASTLNYRHIDLALLVALAGCAAVSDLQALRTGAAKVRISGSFLALIMAMVFSGPPARRCSGWRRSRSAGSGRARSRTTCSRTWPPTAGSHSPEPPASPQCATTSASIPGCRSFYVAVFLLFFAALCINFAWVATYSSHVTGEASWR